MIRSYLCLTMLSCVCLAADVTGAIVFRVFNQFGDKFLLDASVALEDENGVPGFSGNVVNGVVTIQDLPFGEYSAVFNRGKCNEVIIRRVRFRFDSVQTFRVVINRCFAASETYGNGCVFELRVLDSSRVPVRGALVVSEFGAEWKTDAHGRVLGMVPTGDTSISIRRGDRVKAISMTCRRLSRIEQLTEID